MHRLFDIGKVVQDCCFQLNFSHQEFENLWALYNSPESLTTNAIYDGRLIRLVMFYGNFFTENWHEKRSEELISQTKSRNYKKVYYLGFGAIDGGMVNFINQGIELTLSDNYEDAFTVATICLNELVKCDIVRSDWQSYVIFEINDMNQLSPIEGQDLIVALDAIEHANDPGSVLKEISTIPSDVYLSVPVCKKLPFHNQDWATVNDSHTWVTDFGYTLISTKSIYMGAKDTFASGLNLIEEQIYAKH